MTPKEFLAIAKTAVILPGNLENSSRYGRPERLGLIPTTDKGSRKSKPCDVYRIQQSAGLDAFPAYVCDYGEGQLNYQVLSSEADFCFTTTINGCTFAVGAAARDGTVIVSHTNAKPGKLDEEDKQSLGWDPKLKATLEGRNWQIDVQKKLAKQFHGKGRFLDSHTYYKKGEVNVTLFGLRQNEKWKFYYQSFRRASGCWEFTGFHDFSAQSRRF